MPISFGGTLSGGIQDISALLPLLGTEQVAKHVGSSLQRGYLYAAAAPLSIFGSLGQVQASFAIGLASVPSYYGFGARLLKDAGFDPTGEATKMITLDQGKYVAEARFKTASDTLLLNRSHIFSTICPTAPAWKWNAHLIIFSSLAALLSFIPYLHFIIRHDTSRHLLAWLFPLIRAIGALLCVVASQLLLQNRIVTIIQQQIQFMRFDKSMKNGHLIPQTMRIYPCERTIWRSIWEKLQFWRKGAPAKVPIRWGDDATSEECLWDLFCYMRSLPTNDSTLALLSRCIGDDDLTDQAIERLRTQFLPTAFFNMACQLAIFIGMLASIVGYVGCFSIIQDSKASPTGRYLWIGLEAALSVIRIVLWAWNPQYDDSPGLELSLEPDTTPTTGSQFDQLPTSTPRPSPDGTITFDVIDSREFVTSFVRSYGSFPLSMINENAFAIYYAKLRKSFAKGTTEIHITILDIARNRAFLFSPMQTNAGSSFALYYANLDSRQMTVSWNPSSDVVPPEDAIRRNTPLIQELFLRCNILMSTINNTDEAVNEQINMDWLASPTLTERLKTKVDHAWHPIRDVLHKLLNDPTEVKDDGHDIFFDYHAKLWSYFSHKLDGSDFSDFAVATFHTQVQDVFESYFESRYKHPSTMSAKEILSVLVEFDNGLHRVKARIATWGRAGWTLISKMNESIDDWAGSVWFNLIPPSARNETLSTALEASATSLATRCERTGDQVDLDSAISLYQKALMVLPTSHSSRASVLLSLSTALDRRFRHTGQQRDMDNAIVLCNLAYRLSLSTTSHSLLWSLAMALKSRFYKNLQKSDLDQAISLLRQSIDFLTADSDNPPDHSSRLECLFELADMLYSHCLNGGGHVRDFDEAISLYKQVLALWPPEHPLRCFALGGLAQTLLYREAQYRTTANDIDEAISFFKQALELCPAGDQYNQIAYRSGLADALRIRCARGTGNSSDIHEAISLFKQTLELYSPGGNSKAIVLHNLALALLERGRYDITDFNEIISLHKAALEDRPPGHEDRYHSLYDLAHALHVRFYHRGGNNSDLDEAISLYKQALELYPRLSERFVLGSDHLASALGTRFELGYGNISDLDEALSLFKQTLEHRPPGHPYRYDSLRNIADVLKHIFESENGTMSDLNDAISFHKQALELCPSGHPSRSKALFDLANGLTTRFKKGRGAIGDLDEAISLHKQVLELCPPGHSYHTSALLNVALALQARFEHGSGETSDLDEAISLQRQVIKLCPQDYPHDYPYRLDILRDYAKSLRMRHDHPGGGQQSDLHEAVTLEAEIDGSLQPGWAGNIEQVTQEQTGQVQLTRRRVKMRLKMKRMRTRTRKTRIQKVSDDDEDSDWEDKNEEGDEEEEEGSDWEDVDAEARKRKRRKRGCGHCKCPYKQHMITLKRPAIRLRMLPVGLHQTAPNL